MSMLCSNLAIAPCAISFIALLDTGPECVPAEGARSPTNASARSLKKPSGGDVATLSDEALLVRYRDTGNPELFQELVRRYHAPLYRFLCGYVGEKTLAEDVLQNTLLKVHLKCNLYQPGRPVRPWLYKIATRQAIDALRRDDRFAAVNLDQSSAEGADGEFLIADLLECANPGPLAAAQSAERRQLIRESVACLPEQFREVVTLAYFEGMSYSEIANVLNIPLGTVKSRLHLAIGRLQENARASQFSEAG